VRRTAELAPQPCDHGAVARPHLVNVRRAARSQSASAPL